MDCWIKVQNSVVGGTEIFFFKYGKLVARRPLVVILASLLLAGLCALPLMDFKQESKDFKMWIPRDSDYYKNTNWKNARGLSGDRMSFIILKTKDNENILNPESLKFLLHIYETVHNVTADAWGETFRFDTSCARMPKHSASREPPASCYNINETATTVCQEGSLLEVWASEGTYNDIEDALDSLTSDTDVLAKINEDKLESGIFGKPFDVERFIGGIKRSSDGKIVSANALKMSLTGQAYYYHHHWEESFLAAMANLKTMVPNNFELFYKAHRDDNDNPIVDSIKKDLPLLGIGLSIVFIYIVVMLGNFNAVENRVFLSVAGIITVALGFLMSAGICQLCGVVYTYVHYMLAFLLLGIGIDDMFVIVQSSINLNPKEAKNDIEESLGRTMKYAGVAITMTSVTNFLAFLIGGLSALPALSSFCVYAAIGIIFVFFQMITFFLACFSLDQRRINDERNGIICCWKHPADSWRPFKCSQMSIMNTIFSYVANTIIMPIFKVIICCFTLVLLGCAIYGMTQLRPKFDFTMFWPKGSHVREYSKVDESYFLPHAYSGQIYVANLHGYYGGALIGVMNEMVHRVEEDVQSIKENGVKSFIPEFQEFVIETGKQMPQSDEEFRTYLSKFLFTPAFMGWRSSFHFIGTDLYSTDCDKMAPPIQAITFQYHSSISSTESITKTMKAIKKVTQMANQLAVSTFQLIGNRSIPDEFQPKVFAHSKQDFNPTIMDVIMGELGQNFGLALVTVFLCTLFLITNLFTCIIVVCNVFLTLLNVGGFMHFWGLTIDMTSAILITISMGLAVDYAAHIGHGFMVISEDTRDKRVGETIRQMGPAVFNGGFSTFLAFALFSTSKSYIFITFFKVFFLVVVFGLYNSLIVLPVVLSVIGPKPLASDEQNVPDTNNQGSFLGSEETDEQNVPDTNNQETVTGSVTKS